MPGISTWSESPGAAVVICGKGEKLGHTLGRPCDTAQRQGQAWRAPLTGRSGPFLPLSKASSRGRSCARMSSSSIRSSSFRSSKAVCGTPEGGEEGAILTVQAPASAPRSPHLWPGPPGPWSGPSCAGFRQTGSRDRKGSRQAGVAPGPARCSQVPPAWAAASALPGSSAWLRGRCTGPLQDQVRLSGTPHPRPGPLDVPGPHPGDRNLRAVTAEHLPQPPFHPRTTMSGISSPDTMHWLSREQRSQQADLASRALGPSGELHMSSRSRHVRI